MKKISIYLLISFLFNLPCHSQVILGGTEPEVGTPTLNKEDLDIRGNLKIEYIQPSFYKKNNKIIEETDLKRIYLENNTKVIYQNNYLKNILFSVTYFISIGDQTYNIAKFNTKIPTDKYIAVLGQFDLINSQEEVAYNPSYSIRSPYSGYHSVKEGNVFDSNGNWSFSVNYKASQPISNSLWKVTLYVLRKEYTKVFKGETPDVFPVHKPEYRESVKGVGIGTDIPTEMLDVAGNIRIDHVEKSEIKDISPIFLDKNGVFRSGEGEKIAFPIRLKVNLLGNDKDFLYYLRLGLDPNKYTPILANYRFICNDSNTGSFSIMNRPNLQPPLNNLLSIIERGGVEDWSLYMDYYAVNSYGCQDTSWEATLIVFRNAYIRNITLENNSAEAPILLNNYNSTLKGYVGEAQESPNFE